MLTGKQVRVRFGRNNRITPSYIDHGDPSWQAVAERLLELYRGQEGRTRGELEEEVYETFSGDPRQLVHNGLAKLLEDRCEFDVVSGHPPEQLRELVFRSASSRPRRSTVCNWRCSCRHSSPAAISNWTPSCAGDRNASRSCSPCHPTMASSGRLLRRAAMSRRS